MNMWSMGFLGVGIILYDIVWWIHDRRHLSKPVELHTTKENPNVNYGLN